MNPSFPSACEAEEPIRYMDRTRAYYRALGYAEPYRWAHNTDAPFHELRKPLAKARVTIVTTAARFDPRNGDQGPGAPYNGAAKFFDVYSGFTTERQDLRISHVAYDRSHTSAADSGTWFPLNPLIAAANSGRIGAVTARFFGAPTNRSQRVTTDIDAPRILSRCQEDGADAVVLVPNCPVCHQTVSLVARHLEANGIATVVMGCAKDIVEHAAVPRFLFSDFPLGNSAGRPHDAKSQELTLDLALRLLAAAPGPQTTMQSPLRWTGSPAWRRDYNDVTLLSDEDRARRRRMFEAEKARAPRLPDFYKEPSLRQQSRG